VRIILMLSGLVSVYFCLKCFAPLHLFRYFPNPDKEDSNDISDSEQKALDVITAVDKLFLFLFTIELGMNLFVHLHYFVKDAWIVFDFFTIVTSYAFSGVTIMRSFRIFRVFRLFGRIKSLKLVVDAVGSTAENFTSIMAVLLIILYIFAVMVSSLTNSHFCFVRRVNEDWNFSLCSLLNCFRKLSR